MNKKNVWRDVIVFGGSEGALQALTRILATLPPDFRAAMLAVVTTPDRGPTAAQLDDTRLRTPIPLAFAEHDDEVAPGQLSICPPSAQMTLDARGVITLADRAAGAQPDNPVDVLFISAARAFGPRVVAVVLSGGTDDGVAGLKAVGASGGVGIVQSPVDAVDPRAPVHAVAGDHPDTVEMLDAIAPLLMKLSGTPDEAGAS